MRDSGYNEGTDAETSAPFLVRMTNALRKRLHRSSGKGRGRANNGARMKPSDWKAKARRRRKIAAESRKRNRS